MRHGHGHGIKLIALVVSFIGPAGKKGWQSGSGLLLDSPQGPALHFAFFLKGLMQRFLVELMNAVVPLLKNL